MGRSLVSALCLVLLAGQSCAHFVLHSPPTVGFNDDNEGKAPCGGFNPPFKNPSDFHVGGDAIALTTTHPTANWLFRASLDTDAAGGFTDLLPAVSQTSLGNFCEPDITVPSSWAGKSGVLQIVQDAADGILYQCAFVKFVSGKASSAPPSCRNATGVKADFTTDAQLSSALPTGTSAASSGSSGSSASGSPASPSATNKSGADSVHFTRELFLLGVAALGAVAICL